MKRYYGKVFRTEKRKYEFPQPVCVLGLFHEIFNRPTADYYHYYPTVSLKGSDRLRRGRRILRFNHEYGTEFQKRLMELRTKIAMIKYPPPEEIEQ